MKATFRPRLSGLTMKIGGATFLAWLLLGRIEIDVVQQYPFVLRPTSDARGMTATSHRSRSHPTAIYR
jgi:hypothetical protein